MCGIVAILGKGTTHGLTDQMIHRGLDQVSNISYDNLMIGFRRLAITNPDHSQPAIFGDWTVYLNGEIYNYQDFGQGSECEVIASGLETEGVDFIKRLNGMFLIVAIHNTHLYVFRDRYGIKPGYWYSKDGVTIISSEIKPILNHSSYSFEVNESAKRQWMVFNNVLTSEALFKGVHKISKGICWNVTTGQSKKFWTPEFTEKEISKESAIEGTRHYVTQAIKRQIPSVHYGSCLSGGIDSNIIARTIGDIPTFTAGFTEGADERMKCPHGMHYDIVYNRVRDLKKTIYHLEDLRAGASWSNYGLYELASKFVKVLFDGTGSDELFGGYTWRYSAEDYWNIVNRTGIQDDYCRDLFNTIYPHDSTENRFLFDLNYYMESVLLTVDRLSMAHTIEVRVPFLDNDLVDFCLSLPHKFRFNKELLRRAFKDLLPKEILNGKKQGFSSPDWFEGKGNKAQKWAEVAFNTWQEIYG